MTPEEQAAQRTEIKRLLDDHFGAGHECSPDLGAMLRVGGGTTIRFAYAGTYWDLKRNGTIFTLGQAE